MGMQQPMQQYGMPQQQYGMPMQAQMPYGYGQPQQQQQQQYGQPAQQQYPPQQVRTLFYSLPPYHVLLHTAQYFDGVLYVSPSPIKSYQTLFLLLFILHHPPPLLLSPPYLLLFKI